jgi:hypothetical protein
VLLYADSILHRKGLLTDWSLWKDEAEKLTQRHVSDTASPHPSSLFVRNLHNCSFPSFLVLLVSLDFSVPDLSLFCPLSPCWCPYEAFLSVRNSFISSRRLRGKIVIKRDGPIVLRHRVAMRSDDITVLGPISHTKRGSYLTSARKLRVVGSELIFWTNIPNGGKSPLQIWAHMRAPVTLRDIVIRDIPE